MTVTFPASVFFVVESFRPGAKGLIKHVVIVMVLAQILAVSVAVPLLWNPFYWLGGRGTTIFFTKAHSFYVILSCTYVSILTVLFFVLEKGSYPWAVTTGILAGPLIVVPYIIQMFLPTRSTPSDQKTISSSFKFIKQAYRVSMIPSFVMWMVAVLSLIFTYGTEPSDIWGALWGNTNNFCRMINVDTLVWFLAYLMVIFSENPMDALVAFVAAPFVGPGVAIGYTHVKQLETEVKQALEKKD